MSMRYISALPDFFELKAIHVPPADSSAVTSVAMLTGTGVSAGRRVEDGTNVGGVWDESIEIVAGAGVENEISVGVGVAAGLKKSLAIKPTNPTTQQAVNTIPPTPHHIQFLLDGVSGGVILF